MKCFSSFSIISRMFESIRSISSFSQWLNDISSRDTVIMHELSASKNRTAWLTPRREGASTEELVEL